MKLNNAIKNVGNFLGECRLSFENFVLWFFRTLSFKAHVKITFQKIRNETIEHVRYLSWTLKHIVLPLAICYIWLGVFFGKNVLDSLFLGVLIFVYSNFLPDLLSAFKIRNKKEKEKGEAWYKKYALLFLAPIFIFFLLGNHVSTFKTAEHFHNIRSLTAYGIFLFLLGLILYGDASLSWGRVLEVFSPTMFGSIGYVAHLKVDKIL